GSAVVAPPSLGEAYISQHVALVRLTDDVRSEFVAAFIADPAGGQIQINRSQYGQIKPGLGLEDIRSIQIPVPPHNLQNQFVQRLEELHDVETSLENAHQQLENLFQSLLTRAFNGELTAIWREQHAEMLHDEAVQRDIVLGLRNAEPTLGDLAEGRVTRA